MSKDKLIYDSYIYTPEEYKKACDKLEEEHNKSIVTKIARFLGWTN